MLRLTERESARLWRDASVAWHRTGPHAAWQVFRDAGALVLWPVWYRTIVARNRRRYVAAIATASEPRTAKIKAEGRSQYPSRPVVALRRSGTRQSGHRHPGARKERP